MYSKFEYTYKIFVMKTIIRFIRGTIITHNSRLKLEFEVYLFKYTVHINYRKKWDWIYSRRSLFKSK